MATALRSAGACAFCNLRKEVEANNSGFPEFCALLRTRQRVGDALERTHLRIDAEFELGGCR